jgi:hypothetical protein
LPARKPRQNADVGRHAKRAAVCGCFAAGATAGAVAVMSALGGQVGEVSAAQATLTSRTVAFAGGAAVDVRRLPTGTTCFSVHDAAGTARGCLRLNAIRIGYAVGPESVGGVAGPNVRAVIVKLSSKGTVWATLRDGAFVAQVPPGYTPRAVVRVLKDGSRRTYRIRAAR